ncbi:solute carrier family 2, facilitated glucose transporter member 8 [Manduca sexta]|uniref:solute carrier family 2, facilitated glucose transporter member 8 n=1 Tax=Manduca sexta TaxID=7130 RepID=UPI00188FA841|nr:solute carrier family 2, facilitated glucose transporter member 8 [Manduca sexta]
MVYTISGEVNEDKGTLWRELLVAFVASLPFFTHGVETTILTASAHTGHFIRSDDVPWSTTILVLVAGISSPICCYVINRFGRQCGVFIVSFVQGTSLIPLFLLNETSSLILHGFAGLSSGALFTILPTYIRETSSPKIRGISMTLIMAMITAGYMMKLVMSPEERRYLIAALVMCQVMCMLVIVESPNYLVMKGKFETAQKRIAVLKGLPEDNGNVKSHLEELKAESERVKSCAKLSVISLYRNKIWWDSLKMALVLHTTMVLCGNVVFLDQKKSLVQLKLVDSDPENILVLSAMFAGGLFTLVSSIIIDRKYILTLGYVLMALSSGTIAVYTQADLTVYTLRWIPVASLAVLVFGYGVSWALPFIITVEVFNFEIQATILGTIFTYSQAIKLLHIHTFKYIENYVGVYTMFYIFASINLYGAVYSLFIVPNTRHKSMKQIEKQIKRIPLPA